jgi:IclR family KDG regulon transcriptional repressor
MHTLALRFMRDLIERMDLTCHLAILGQYEAVHLEKIVARRCFQLDTSRSVGERVPLYSSSVGKALLAWQSRAVLEASLPSLRLHKTGPKTITTQIRLLTELEEVRKQGYALDDEECRPKWRCVGAPIFDQLGSAMVAICLTGTVEEMDDSKLGSTAEGREANRAENIASTRTRSGSVRNVLIPDPRLSLSPSTHRSQRFAEQSRGVTGRGFW